MTGISFQVNKQWKRFPSNKSAFSIFQKLAVRTMRVYPTYMRYFIMTLLLTVLMTSQSYGEVYRWVDAKGNVSYSDKPQEGADLIPIDTVAKPAESPTDSRVSVDGDGIEDIGETEELLPAPSYTLTIVEPKNDEAMRSNAGDVMVVVEISPELNEKREDQFMIYLDDRASPDMKTSKLFIMQGIDRGTHTVRVDVVDKQGEVLTSASSVFHLQRYSIQNNNNNSN